MDLLRAMKANREKMGMAQPVTHTPALQQLPAAAVALAPGTKQMRAHIIQKKPKPKIVKKHFEAIIAQECESSSESD